MCVCVCVCALSMGACVPCPSCVQSELCVVCFVGGAHAPCFLRAYLLYECTQVMYSHLLHTHVTLLLSHDLLQFAQLSTLCTHDFASFQSLHIMPLVKHLFRSLFWTSPSGFRFLFPLSSSFSVCWEYQHQAHQPNFVAAGQICKPEPQ